MVKNNTEKLTDHNGKEVKVTKGKNIRFTDKSHSTLVKFCRKKGYHLGAFCELGALEKMRNEIATP